MSPSQRRRMSLYERTLEKFARMPVGDWYMKTIAPRVDPPLLRLTGGRISPEEATVGVTGDEGTAAIVLGRLNVTP